MRECGECTKCCEWLIGEAYGNSFGNGIACKFLDSCGCRIYKLRPNACINYYCAWAQELLPDEMRPDKCEIIASVENKEGTQYLRLSGNLSSDLESFFKNWSRQMNTPVLYSDRIL